jgi:rare lipoprotein A
MKRIILFILTGLVAVCFCAAQVSDNGSFTQEGIASWYGTEFEGKPTASGELFNSSLFTAAHPTLPFGTVLKITSKHNNKSVIVRVNDRGPFVSARIIDISKAAAQQLDMLKTGTAPVIVESLPAAAQTEVSVQNSEAAPRTAAVPHEVPAVQNTGAPAQPVSSAFPSQPWQAPARIAPAQLKGAVPGDNNAKLYRIQVGAYVQPRNAVETFEKLKSAGLNPSYEKFNEFYRVVISGIRNTEIHSVAEKLGQAGFREAIVKEEN